jgi:hypothetical protein
LLDYVSSARYEVRDAVPVGRMPLRTDVVLIRRGEGDVPEHLARELHAIHQRHNLWALIEADAVSGPGEPVLTHFSRRFLRDRERTMNQFMIQHTDTSVMEDIEQTLRAYVLETATPDEWE